MALDDIDFSEGEGQDFIVEVPLDTLHAPLDIVVEPGGSQFILLETPLIVDGGGGGGDIFIIND